MKPQVRTKQKDNLKEGLSRGVIPLDNRLMTINPNSFYFDYYNSLNINTTPTSQTMLGNLLAAGGLLTNFPAIATPTISTGGFASSVHARVRIRYADVCIRAIGAQSNTIAAGDLFNTIRVGMFQCGENYQTAQLSPFSSNLDYWYDTKDLVKVYFDDYLPLPSQAFDSLSNYNVPQVLCKKFRVPIKLTLDCISGSVSGSGTAWNTKRGDIFWSAVSDSSVSPNPSIVVSCRFYFKILH